MGLLYKIILRVWNKQPKKVKLLIALLMLVSIYAIGRTAQYTIYRYKYFKHVEAQYKTIKKQIEDVEIEAQNIVLKTQKRTKIVQKRNIEIDKKLMEDEKTINTSTVTDDDLKRYISKHQKR